MNPGAGVLYHKLPDHDSPTPPNKTGDLSDSTCEFNMSKAVHYVNRSRRPMYDWMSRVADNEFLLRILTAVFYASTSFLIMVVNKIVLTTYHFPSSHFLGLGQMLATIAVLGLGKRLRLISFPDLSSELPRKVSVVMMCACTACLTCSRSFPCLSFT